MAIFNGMPLMTSGKEDIDNFINSLQHNHFNYVARIYLGEHGEKYGLKGIKAILVIKYGIDTKDNNK